MLGVAGHLRFVCFPSVCHRSQLWRIRQGGKLTPPLRFTDPYPPADGNRAPSSPSNFRRISAYAASFSLKRENNAAPMA